MDFVLAGMANGMGTGMILIGLQKAFDTLDYEIPQEKMTCRGFKTPVIKCF